MSVWDYVKRVVRDVPKLGSFTPPPPPPISPVIVQRRIDALERHALDCMRFKVAVVKAMSTGILPSAPPSPNWYESHPNYVWNPDEPNPERPDPEPVIPPPNPNPQPTPEEVDNQLKAQNRWKADWDWYRKLQQDRRRLPKSRPPSTSYYVANPNYMWNPWAKQVKE